MRVPFAKEYNLEDFEFSQGYLFFWDKVFISRSILKCIDWSVFAF